MSKLLLVDSTPFAATNSISHFWVSQTDSGLRLIAITDSHDVLTWSVVDEKLHHITTQLLSSTSADPLLDLAAPIPSVNAINSSFATVTTLGMLNYWSMVSGGKTGVPSWTSGTLLNTGRANVRIIACNGASVTALGEWYITSYSCMTDSPST